MHQFIEHMSSLGPSDINIAMGSLLPCYFRVANKPLSIIIRPMVIVVCLLLGQLPITDYDFLCCLYTFDYDKLVLIDPASAEFPTSDCHFS